jgi:hypothetical protein
MKTVAKTPAPLRKASLLALFAACLLLLCVLLLVAAGVRSGPTVTGIVRLDGQPLAAGWIKFVPIGRTPGPDAGAAIEEGEYQIDKGLSEGEYRVEIQGTQTMPQMVFDPAGPGARVHNQKLLVPPEFNQNSKLIERVHAGSNLINFEVKGFENKATRKGK